MSEPKAHAKFAASSSDRWLTCAASIKLSEGVPSMPSTKAAAEGTRAHDLMDMALKTNVKDVVKFFANDDEIYPLEMRKHVQGFVDYVRGLLNPHNELLVEERVHLDQLHITEAFGTVDVAIIEHFGLLHIVDFKYGKTEVEAQGNTQMIYYALGLLYKHNYDFESVKITIYQPRAGKEAFRSATYTVDELRVYEKRFKDQIDLCESEGAEELTVSGDHCFFCPAKIKCPEITTKALQKAKLVFSAPIQPDPKFLTSDQLKTILDRSAYLLLWVKDVRAYAEKILNEGGQIEGWGLKTKRASRVWVNQNKVLKSLWGEDLVSQELVSPAQAEKILKGLNYDADAIKDFMKENVVHVSSGTTLSQTDSQNNFDFTELEISEVD